MEIDHLCARIKEQLALELRQAPDAGARGELLIAALYETSRTVLPALGTPRKSVQYQKAQEAVLDLISCIAIPLIRDGVGQQRGVAVLSELAEGCHDPLLRKKLSVYAQELLAKSSAHPGQGVGSGGRRAAMLLASCAAAALAQYLAWPDSAPERRPQPVSAATAPAPSSAPLGAGLTASLPVPPDRTGTAERAAASPPAHERAPAAPVAAPQGEQATRVRIVNNQVLVPVTLKHGGASVRLELVLDTGATRTAIHDVVTSRLPIDLRAARSALAEVADGRVIRSRIARIDQLSVGPFAHGSMELEVIPYGGSDGMHDGLLGMDFLGKHRYQIDMEHELIRWF